MPANNKNTTRGDENTDAQDLVDVDPETGEIVESDEADAEFEEATEGEGQEKAPDPYSGQPGGKYLVKGFWVNAHGDRLTDGRGKPLPRVK